MVERVLEFEEALELVLDRAAALARPGTERVGLPASRERVLAEAIRADRDQPAFDRATRDGFAVRAGDLMGGGPLRVVGSVRAGEVWSGPGLGLGEAIEIMTGAPMPAGADAVVMVEHVGVSGGEIALEGGRELRAGDNFVPCGAEAREGKEVLGARVAMGAAEIAMGAACGAAEVMVFRRPRVAIVATGDELVEIEAPPEGGQIRDSNSYGIAAMVEQSGGIGERLRVARDTRGELLERVTEGRGTDLLLFSGGVSMGKYDLVEEVLAELGAEFFFTGVRMQPGKPVVFGRLPRREEGEGAGKECLFFGLPGNPISTQVTFQCFVEPLLRAMGGEEVSGPRFVQAVMAEDAAGNKGLTRLLPGRMTGFRKVGDPLGPEVRLTGWKGSGDMAANARSNCYVVLPRSVERFSAGDVVTVLLR